MNHGLKAPDKDAIDFITPVGGQQHRPVAGLSALKQISDFLVGVLVMGIRNNRWNPSDSGLAGMR